MGRRAKSNVSIPDAETAKDTVETLVANDNAMEYLKKNVSKRSLEVLSMLVTPKTDEYLAEKLELKINAIRRILNIMQGYGITNYYISKNTNGWLSFSWYINTSKLQPFLDYINNMERESAVVNENCNDYFICNDCYKSDKIIYPFEAAFENNFRCNCGNKLDRMDSAEVAGMLNKKSAPAQEQTRI
jgi:transcription initiation factor TFIIE subunit alpha